jgi:hypothetical protein
MEGYHGRAVKKDGETKIFETFMKEHKIKIRYRKILDVNIKIIILKDKCAVMVEAAAKKLKDMAEFIKIRAQGIYASSSFKLSISEREPIEDNKNEIVIY